MPLEAPNTKSFYTRELLADIAQITIALHMKLLILSLALLSSCRDPIGNVQAAKLQASGCESLLSSTIESTSAATLTLSSYCQCNDEPFGERDANDEENASFISQLECWPPHLAKFEADFELALRNGAAGRKIKIDYLHISTNMTTNRQVTNISKRQIDSSSSNSESLDVNHATTTNPSPSTNPIAANEEIINDNDGESLHDEPMAISSSFVGKPDSRALIDHLAIQLTGQQRQRERADDWHRSINQSCTAARCLIGRQLNDLGRLINETHLQFLSILLILDNNSSEELILAAKESQTAHSDTNNSIEESEHGKKEEGQESHRAHVGISNNNNDHDLVYDYELDDWLGRLNNLIRLELNGFTNQVALSLTKPIKLLPKLSPKLKWLSLARNSFPVKSGRMNANATNTNKSSPSRNNRPELEDLDQFLNEQQQQQHQHTAHRVANEPFGLPSELEFLSLESCKLEQFQVVDMLLQKVATSSSSDGRRVSPSSLQKNLGHSRITSLNLASNKLAHLELDFFHGLELVQANKINAQSSIDATLAPFCARINLQQMPLRLQQQQIGQNYYFQLNSLIQLDLSQNSLKAISHKAGQMLLCIAPNLSQLYLNQNKLVHLRLDSLLWIKGLGGRYWSKLEHLDVSSNELALISTTSKQNMTLSASSLHLKSINLAQNKLTFRPQINQVSQDIINLFGSDADDENLLNLFALFELKNNNDNNTLNLRSFCDLFDHSSVHNDDGVSQNEISFAKNRLQFIGQNEFRSYGCRYVQILRLNQNIINSIDRDAFNQMNQLELLDLSENQLEVLTEEVFSQTRSLKVINLRSNRLLSLPKTLFSNLKQLEEIRLDNNELMQLPSGIFEQNLALTIINLASNRLVSGIDEMILAQLNQLEQLKLDGNQLSSFNVITANRLPTLLNNQLQNSTSRSHNLSHFTGKSKMPTNNHRKHANSKGAPKKRRQNRRQLTVDETNTSGSSQGYLEVQSDLILSSNQLTSFGDEDPSVNNNHDHKQLIATKNCPNYLHRTRSLWLNDNRLRQLNGTTFKCFTNLVHLSLQKNLLNTLSLETFENMKNLEYLDLSSNQLGKFDSNLKQSMNIRYLSLQQNKLEEISLSEIFALESAIPIAESKSDITHMTTLETLNLSHNPKLSIELADFSSFLRSAQSMRRLQLRAISKLWFDPNSNSSIMSPSERLQLDLVDLGLIKSIHELLWGLLSNHLVSIDKLDLSNFDVAGYDKLEKSEPFTANDKPFNVNGKSPKLASFISSSLQHDLMSLNVSQNKASWLTLMQVLRDEQSDNAAPIRYQLSQLEARQIELGEWPFDGQLSKKLANLAELDLSFNKLKHMFDRRQQQTNSGHLFAKLQTLNLSFNLITNLVNGETSGNNLRLTDFMPNLIVLDLSYNKIQWISDNFFHDLKNLKTVKLSHNQLETIPSFGFDSNRKQSLTLELAFNQIYWTEEINNPQLESKQKGSTTHTHDKFFQCLSSTHDFNMQFPLKVSSQSVSSINSPSDLKSQFNDPNEINSNQANRPNVVASIDGDSSYTICHELFESVDSLRLDHANLSSRPVGHNTTLKWLATRPFSLNLDHSRLSRWPLTLTPHETMKFMVKLTINFNELEHVHGDQFCELYPNVMSLEMSNNKLGTSRINLVDCSRLSYLDMSFNELTGESLFAKHHLGSSDSLQILRLRHNKIAYLNKDMLNSVRRDFPSLRFIDLRDNRLVSQSNIEWVIQFQPRLTIQLQNESQDFTNGRHVITPSSSFTDHANKPVLEASHSSLSVDLTHIKTQVSTKGPVVEALCDPNVTQSGNNSTTPVKLRFNSINGVHELKFCTISSLITEENTSKLCLLDIFDPQEQLSERQSTEMSRRDCVAFKMPVEIKSCLTNLDEQIAISKLRIDNTSVRVETNAHIRSVSSSDFMAHNNSSNRGGQSQQTDIVINTIDAIKGAWIRIKQFDLNQFLIVSSSVQPDNVLTVWNGQPVYTLTVLRVSVLCGAMIIITLLIVVFFLLTSNTMADENRQNNKSKEKSHDSSSSESPTTESHCFSTSGNSTCYSTSTIMSHANSSMAQQTDTTNPTGTNKHLNNSSASSSGPSDLKQTRVSSSRGLSTQHKINSSRSSENTTSNDSRQLITQINLHELDPHSYQILDPNQFLANQNNNCSTPNSSLAPSSIETVETLQAIDSIQSSLLNPSTHDQISSIDQYNDSDIYHQDQTRHQQQQQTLSANADCPVATVMRMVKSNSSNTFHNNNQPNNRTLVQPIPFNSNIYNTLNQANYTAFKNKMRKQSTNPPTIYENNPSYSVVDNNLGFGPNIEIGTVNDTLKRLNHLDSATLSLQSLNTTLVATIANAGTQNWAPSADNKEDSFCRYHQHNQQNHQNMPVMTQSHSNYNMIYQVEGQQNQQRQQGSTFDDVPFDIIGDINESS